MNESAETLMFRMVGREELIKALTAPCLGIPIRVARETMLTPYGSTVETVIEFVVRTGKESEHDADLYRITSQGLELVKSGLRYEITQGWK